MEEETQMQDEMLVEEAPKTMPLEEHTTSSSVKEINPKTSKWLWFVVVMIVVLVSFGIAWFIIQENDRLSSDIEFGAVTHSEKLTSKAIKGIGDTLSDAKKMVEENGDGLGEVIGNNGLGFEISTPNHWHIATGLGQSGGFELWLNPTFFDISPKGGYPAVFYFREVEKEQDDSLEDVLVAVREKYEEPEESTFESNEGVVIHKIQGERQLLFREGLAMEYYFEAFDSRGDNKVYKVDTELMTEEQQTEMMPLLEKLLQTVKLFDFEESE